MNVDFNCTWYTLMVHLHRAIANTNAKAMPLLLLQKPILYHAKAASLVVRCKHQTENSGTHFQVMSLSLSQSLGVNTASRLFLR